MTDFRDLMNQRQNGTSSVDVELSEEEKKDIDDVVVVPESVSSEAEKTEETKQPEEASPESEDGKDVEIIETSVEENPVNFENQMTSQERQQKNRDFYGGDISRYSNGMLHYSGVLGTFDYDPNEFELRRVRVESNEEDDFEGGEFPILAYKGKETNGAKIQIPKGLVDGSMMFDGNQTLESIPELPSSLRVGFAMFRGCENVSRMEDPILPMELRDAQFMFADCSNLRSGPLHIPSSMRDGTAMFANCEKLRNTPDFEEGILCTDSMFANCKSLTKKPELPRSVMFNDQMTYGCSSIDQVEKARSLDATEQRADDFQSKIDEPSFRSRLGAIFSAVMQYHYLRTKNYSITQAFMTTRDKRKEGSFATNASSGWKALYNTNKTGLSGAFAGHMAKSSERREKSAEEGKKFATDRFSALNRTYKDVSNWDYKFYNKGSKDAVKKLDRLGKTGYVTGTDMYADVMNRLDDLEADMQKSVGADGTMSFAQKKEFAYEMIELMSNQEAYYHGAVNVVSTEAGKRGLKAVTNANIEAILDRAESLQNRFQFMNDRQISALEESAKTTSYAERLASDAGKMRIDMMRADFRKGETKIEKGVEKVKLSNARQDFIQRRGLDRGKITDERFGFIGNQAQDVAEKSSDGYDL